MASKIETELLTQIQILYENLRSEMQRNWNRDLPFEELLSDRWERAKRLGFGEKSSIYQNSYVYGDVKVGAQTWIGPFTILDGTGGLEIGDHCSIGAGVQIYSHDVSKWCISGGVEPYVYTPVKIGNCCFIAPSAIIARGVSIGDGTLVESFSVVKRKVPAYSIVFGNPAVVVGKVHRSDKGEVTFRYLKKRLQNKK